MKRKLCLLLCALLITGCDVTPDLPGLPRPQASGPPVEWTAVPLQTPAQPCEDRFVAHDLPHTTTTSGPTVHLYASNGSGLAVNDLDNDGDLEIVLGNLAGPNRILWNEGRLRFRAQAMPVGQTRAVNLVDFDGDGWQDIALTRRMKRPEIWRSSGGPAPRFAKVEGLSVWEKAYSQAWADLDGDTDLDWAVAAYDAELTRGDPTRFGSGGGVSVYRSQPGGFIGENLAFTAQALALLLTDLDGDGRTDILVGNDFYLHDFAWLQQPDGGWQEATPFPVMPMNTMSYAAGDLENDGDLEFFVGDMKPARTDEQTLAAWQPVMENMQPIENDPQVMENVLNAANAAGVYENQSGLRGVDATGWSWSAQFGDLDNDGFLDLYVVNGMQAEELFGHLPNDELVEENLAYRNDGTGAFVEMPAWGLNSQRGGRGMALADVDNDGDLDAIVNNLGTPAQLFENRLCRGDALALDLFWPGTGNSRAIGAQAVLHTSAGSLRREVRSASGYLTGEPARLHFGLPPASRPISLEIRWPDGRQTRIPGPALAANTRLSITRGQE